MRGRWLVVGLGVTLAAGYGVGQWQLMSVRAVIAQQNSDSAAPISSSPAPESIDGNPFQDVVAPAIPAPLTPSIPSVATDPAVHSGSAALEPEPPQTARAVAVTATLELEQQFLEASREIFRSMSEQQQREALAATLAQLKQAQAMNRLAKLKAELQALANDFPQTEAARMALDAAQRLERPAAAPGLFSSIPLPPQNDAFGAPPGMANGAGSAEDWKAFLKVRSLQPIPEDSLPDLR